MKFCQYLKPISISLSPNTEKDDIWLAFKLLFQPWRWQKELTEARPLLLEEEFKRYLGVHPVKSAEGGALLNNFAGGKIAAKQHLTG